LKDVVNVPSSYSRVRGSQFRLPCAVPLYFAAVLPWCSPCSPRALLVLFCASPMLPCCAPLLPQFSLSRSKTAISNPKVRVYIIYIYIVSPNRGQLLMLARSCLTRWCNKVFGMATVPQLHYTRTSTKMQIFTYKAITSNTYRNVK